MKSTPAPSPSRSHAIEQVYHEGALYRVEQPAVSAVRRVAIPAPHFQLPPRSSPRRTIRRSVLKLLGGEAEPVAPNVTQASIKASGKRPLLRSGARFPEGAARTSRIRTIGRLMTPARQELAPETIFDTPRQDEPLPIEAAPAYQPALPPMTPPPPPATLNIAAEFGRQIEVHGHWEAEIEAASGSLVILPEPADLDAAEHSPRVDLQLDAMPLPAKIEPDIEIEAPTPPALIDDVQLPQPTLRIDPAHADITPRPHAKFKPQQDEAPAESQSAAYFGDAAEETEQVESNTDSELNFADLDPAAAAATIAAATQDTTDADEPAVASQETPIESAPQVNCVPVWEVDRFQWPITVERLVSDKSGYFAQAGDRLMAAVRDGLRMLAVTGSRRSEGRTTLALCLARAAANAGLQVAVIDADFTRPQLAARLGLEVSHGWQDAATGSIPLSEAAVRSLTDEITVLPLEAATRGQLSLADPRVTATLRAAAATFELVIVDLGPLAPGEDELFPEGEACPFDAAIVVRDLRYATAAESESIGERLYAAGIEAVGVAENFVVEEELPVTSV